MSRNFPNSHPVRAPILFFRVLIAALLFASSSGLAPAATERVWTDVDGRTMRATILGIENGRVRVLFQGKETSVPLERLSAADREYVEKWEEENKGQPAAGKVEMPPAAAGGGATFNGKPLDPGGKIQLFEFEYDAEYKQKLDKKFKAEDTGYRIAIAAPQGFDPSKPQKVLVALCGHNNDAQIKAGNVAALRAFAGKAVAEGWVCIAYDSDLGAATKHNGAYHQAIDKIL